MISSGTPLRPLVVIDGGEQRHIGRRQRLPKTHRLVVSRDVVAHRHTLMGQMVWRGSAGSVLILQGRQIRLEIRLGLHPAIRQIVSDASHSCTAMPTSCA